ncbi:molybdopterin-dependent oxidoreductase [Nonomuraea endophytica]|uniref:DMSO/TMAO reductase YedYZ molybdopterin-dependent catalytic subunit n=1 Tax=Nonomuraea endophytica TaxID=714136 RepID=A0A7W8ACY5_9ACTN|nr:molybdopterin-dependent oxidoreductase [Nonomuraea endophytica]MBB5083986.1 DMSO/TMAO reductase YedYZ molybdopterin-dependent catalytic subunit [Nonomuraea endophytica]
MSRKPHHVIRAASAGLLSVAAALAVAEFVARFTGGQSSPVVTIGSVAIDLTPTPVKEFAVRTFGTADKAVLVGGILLVLMAVSAGLGILATHQHGLAVAAVAGLGVLGMLAAATRPAMVATDLLPALVAALVGAFTLTALTRPAAEVAPGRRRALRAGLGVVALASLGGLATRLLPVEPLRARFALPRPASPARPLPPGTDLRIPGLTPFTTPKADFYRVDTALSVPRLDAATWTLRVIGASTIELTMADVLRRGLIERDITLTCVSNEVGGPYASHARWLGLPLATLLREAGLPPGADQLLSRSADGWTAGTPLATIMDGRDAMLAVGMNGEPLPAERGHPARLVVPGLYGYVSATKWLVELHLTRYDRRQAYWTERGWATDAPIKTASRIDVPAPLAALRPGPVTVAGVAWAQHRGVASVEVRVGENPWQRVRLAATPSADTWVQWSWTWQATPGTHTLQVRATDTTGRTQPPARVPPFPDGATGRHSIVVTVA